MDKLWQNVIDNKGNPIYWPILLILAIISMFYRLGLLISRFSISNPTCTKAAVISVGNLTVGGTGKTPVTIFLARYFIDSGKKVGIVCSGYGRKNKVNIAGSGTEISDVCWGRVYCTG